MVKDYFVDIAQFLSSRVAPTKYSVTEKQMVVKYVDYQLIVGYLYKLGVDRIL